MSSTVAQDMFVSPISFDLAFKNENILNEMVKFCMIHVFNHLLHNGKEINLKSIQCLNELFP